MKKSILAIILLIYVFLPANVKAETNFSGNAADREEIQVIQNNEERLLTEVKGMIPEGEDALKLNLDDAIKVYIDVDLFDKESLPEEAMPEKIAGKECVWLIPIYTEHKTYWVTVAKGRQVSDTSRAVLSPDEIETLESKVGQWTVSEITEEDDKYSYKEAISQVLQEQGIEDGRVYIFGGTRGYRNLLAVVYEDGKAYFLPVKNVMDRALRVESEEGSEKVVLSFSEMKEMLEGGTLEEGEVGGDAGVNSSNHVGALLGILGAAGCVGIAVLFMRRKKREK